MRVAITGASGLIGSELTTLLETEGHTVASLVRRPASTANEIQWSPDGNVELSALEGFDTVIHLAGENIAAGRWTSARKRAIRDSRVVGTRTLAGALSRLVRKPSALVCASAIGYYGDRGAERLDEASGPGRGFLAGVVREWEAASKPAVDAGIRVAHLRLGVVLSTKGGALARMLPVFRLGLGGVLGSGTQYMSWISLRDAARALYHLALNRTLSGPFNGVSPEPVTNRRYTASLASAVHRPAFLPVPRLALRLALGEMGRELLLASARVEPVRLRAADFVFQDPELETALRHVLGEPS